MIVAIHQPNFFPHQGFFEKMRESDLFVLLTHCQFEKNGYQNRFRYKDEWFTMSVRNKTEDIIAKEYIDSAGDWEKITDKLPKLKFFDSCICDNLVFTNYYIIEKIAKFLDIKTKIIFDYPTNLKGSERLLHICKYYKASTYLSGPSGRQYLDVKLFEQSGVEVEFQDKKESKPIIDLL